MDPPPKPDESDCCNSGCIPCILDVYQDQLKKYLKSQKQQHDGEKVNCMSLTSYSIFRVTQIEKHTRDCNLYTFEYLRAKTRPISSPSASVLYEPGQHFLLRAPVNAETSQKAYTPIYQENQPSNQFTILVKLYETGKMSQYFRKMTIGMETLWRGPYGDYKISYSNKFMLFIAQGTGIAPFYTIIRNILQNDECYTFLTLYFCCHAFNVLLRDELYKMRENWNFKYELFVSSGCEDEFPKKYGEVVNYSKIKEADIQRHLERARGCKVLVCGAQSFCDNVKNMLIKCGLMDGDITIF
ncbi:NADH-cytochrome b5 reductase-like [Euwallacea similis]|uniref:NADH-cytochrome b5 reductase-like n=1 Tax=Euwallacea similis TaxID=1736056 RepID=UPI00344FC48A